MIDWKSLVQVAGRQITIVILTIIATKWADAAVVVQKLMAGDTVSLWNGSVNLSLTQIQLWLTTGIIALVGIIMSWVKRVRLKREANIALQLPKGATKADVKTVSAESPTLSVEPDPAALREVTNSLKRVGI